MILERQRVLVTGAAGFIGGALCDHLRGAGAVVVPQVRSARPGIDGAAVADLETADLGTILADVAPDVIVHCAGRIGEPGNDADRLRSYAANFEATERLMQAAMRQSVRPRMVLVASAAIYAPMGPDQGAIAEDYPLWPVGHYGISKAAAVMAAQAHAARGDLAVVTAVPFNVLGPSQPMRLVPQAYITQLRDTPGRVQVGDLSAVRDWVDVRDVCGAIAALAAPGVPPGLYNIATGQGRTTGAVLDHLCRLMGLQPEIAMNKALQNQAIVSRSIGDPGKIARTCNWRATRGLDEALSDMLMLQRS